MVTVDVLSDCIPGFVTLNEGLSSEHRRFNRSPSGGASNDKRFGGFLRGFVGAILRNRISVKTVE